MKWELLVLVLVSDCGFRWGHYVTARPASTVQVRLGEDAALQCPLLDASATPAARGTLSWYRKSPEQSPQLLLSFRSSGSVMGMHSGGAGPGTVTYGAGKEPGKVTHGGGADPGEVTYGADPEKAMYGGGADPGTVKYGAGVDPKKVSVAFDGSLLLHDSARSDAAVYYCGISQGGGGGSQGEERKQNATPQKVTMN